jgi:hypothetical protein
MGKILCLLAVLILTSSTLFAEDKSYLNRFTQKEADKAVNHFATVNFRFKGGDAGSSELLEMFNTGLFADEVPLQNFTAGTVLHGYIEKAGTTLTESTIISTFEHVEDLVDVTDSGNKAIYKSSKRIDESDNIIYWGAEHFDDARLTDEIETRFVNVKPNASMTSEFKLKHVMVRENGAIKVLNISYGTPNSMVMKAGDIRGLIEIYPYKGGFLYYSASIVNFRKFASTEKPENLQKKNIGMFYYIKNILNIYNN